MSVAAILAEGLSRLKLVLDADAQEKLLAYLALVTKWNKVYNLTAVREPEKMLTHHLLDCLAVVPHVHAARSILDVGSGAGLPGIPLALALPQTRVTLLDSNQKKAAFLQQAVIELTLANIAVVCKRVDQWQSAQKFDVVISRAFSELPEFAALAGPLVVSGGMLVAMKGVRPREEITRLAGEFKLSKITPLAIPGLDAERHLVFLQAA